MSIAGIQQIKTIASSISRLPPDDATRFAALFASFLGTSFGYLAIMRKNIQYAMLRNVFQEFTERQTYLSECPTAPNSRQEATQFDSIYNSVAHLIESMTNEAQDKIIRCFAKKIPLRCEHVIINILLELPNIGTVLEIAPHDSVMFVSAALEAKRASFDKVHGVHGIPIVSTWKTSHIQTIIINALNLRALTYIFIDFVHALVKNDQAIFAVIVHGSDIIINFPLAVITIPMSDNISMTIITGNEKKIVSISNVVKTE